MTVRSLPGLKELRAFFPMNSQQAGFVFEHLSPPQVSAAVMVIVDFSSAQGRCAPDPPRQTPNLCLKNPKP